MGKDTPNPLKKVERAKTCMSRMKKCGVIWFILSVLIFIVGIILLIFFAEYISTDKWQRGVGITGVVFLIIGLVAFAVAVFIIWAFCHLVNRQEKSMAKGGVQHKYHQNSFPSDLYPRQQGIDGPMSQYQQSSPHHVAGGYPAGPHDTPDGPQAPSAPEKAPVSTDAIVIETDTKY